MENKKCGITLDTTSTERPSRLSKIKKNLPRALLITVLFLCLAFAEYRYIMCNLSLRYGENNTVYAEIFGQFDTYYVDGYQEFPVK